MLDEKMMHFQFFFFLISSLLLLPTSPAAAGEVSIKIPAASEPHSPFSSALDALQTQIRYEFKEIDLLSRALTHASYSRDNNRALSILGLDVVRASISMHLLLQNLDTSAEDLSRRLSAITSGKTCAVDGNHLGLEKIVRVSVKTNSSAESVVCGAYRAIFGAVAMDSGNSDDAGNLFWKLRALGDRFGAL